MSSSSSERALLNPPFFRASVTGYTYPTQLILNPQIVLLLISGADPNAGDLNPAVLGGNKVTIIVRMTITYTDNNPDNDPNPPPLVFEEVVEPDDWNDDPCSYLEDDCVVFDNDDILMFAPDAIGGFATLSLNEVNAFTAQSNVTITNTTCDVRCMEAGECATALEPAGTGVAFGIPNNNTFNNGFCDPSIWNDPHVTGLRGQRYDWFGEDGGWYAFL